MSAEQTLKQKIEAKIEHYRNAIAELTALIKDEPAPARKSAGAASPAPAVHSDEPKTSRGRPRKRRKAGWMGDNVSKVLTATPRLTVGEISERLFSQTGQNVKSSLVNTFLSKGEKDGVYSKDNNDGPRKTRWSLVPGAAGEGKKGRKKG